ncbi:hypothetical protein [Atlantibacter sp.]|uniref:hypothetical protein n=1 Tax=Atlantibacter sp. TaxID=1903473 RepID=UPI0028ABAD4C|nr:hypothetical protein [Atlantibacter sp.]
MIVIALALSSMGLCTPGVALAGYSDYESFSLVRTDKNPAGGARKICTYRNFTTREYVQLEMPVCQAAMYRNLRDGMFYDHIS